MMNSNQTLRFPRTYREATGMDAHFGRDPDAVVAIGLGLLAMFLLGLGLGLALAV
jgi:hypothetical protein